MLTCVFENGDEASLRHAVVQGIVLNQDNQLMLIKRAVNLIEGSKWALPGGYVERDETLPEALTREVKEETGWEIKNIKLISIYDNPNRPREDRQNIAFNYICLATKQTGQHDHEVTATHWFSLTDPVVKNLAFDHSNAVNDFISQKNIRD